MHDGGVGMKGSLSLPAKAEVRLVACMSKSKASAVVFETMGVKCTLEHLVYTVSSELDKRALLQANSTKLRAKRARLFSSGSSSSCSDNSDSSVKYFFGTWSIQKRQKKKEERWRKKGR